MHFSASGVFASAICRIFLYENKDKICIYYLRQLTILAVALANFGTFDDDSLADFGWRATDDRRWATVPAGNGAGLT